MYLHVLGMINMYIFTKNDHIPLSYYTPMPGTKFCTWLCELVGKWYLGINCISRLKPSLDTCKYVIKCVQNEKYVDFDQKMTIYHFATTYQNQVQNIVPGSVRQ